MLRPTFVALVCAAAALAQNPADIFSKPPEEVDKALRSRINEFYEDHVTGKFREAEKLVAEDTQDFFYTSNKPKYLSFSIDRINYSDDFTKAKAIILCEQFVMVPGFTDKPIKIPTPSTWKLVNGQWYWYVDQKELRQTPFGTMNPGTQPGSGPVPSPSAIPTSAAFVMNQVKPETQSVELAPGGSAEVTISNTAPGSMTLAVATKPPGIEAQLSVSNVPAKEKATLTLKAGDHAKSGTLSITVKQTMEVIPIRIIVH